MGASLSHSRSIDHQGEHDPEMPTSMAPSAGLEGGGGGAVEEPQAMMSSDSLCAPVPTSVSWAHDGHIVFVTGAWDNWSSKAPLHRGGPGELLLAVIAMPPGVHQYKYIVDGNWMHNPSLPTTTDEHGNLNNVIDVAPKRPEFDEDNLDAEQPLSPPASFNYSVIDTEGLRAEPPELPAFLQVPPLQDERLPPPTAYVRIDHLFGSSLVYTHPSAAHLVPPQELYRTMACTKRYKSKMITTVLVCE